MEPHPIPFIRFLDNSSKTFKLNLEELNEILLREHIVNRDIVIVSVCGAFRSGKSFLLNFFLRYLNAQYVNGIRDDWLSETDDPLVGFPWCGGSVRQTIGINMWSEPFLAQLDDGTEVAIILLDTQGTFDLSSSFAQSTTVFGFSSLISSMQIYNVKNVIGADDLSNLRFFMDYSQQAQQAHGQDDTNPFQHLFILVRDWQNPGECPYGIEGGKDVLVKALIGNEDDSEELTDIRKSIVSAFKKISCFLMPHPGLEITSVDFEGKICDIHPKFIVSLKELVPMVLSPQRLIRKQFTRRCIKAGEWLSCLTAFANAFQNDLVTMPQQVGDAIREIHNSNVKEVSLNIYLGEMQKWARIESKCDRSKQLLSMHDRAKSMCLSYFTQNIIGNNPDSEKWLNQTIDSYYNTLRSLNEKSADCGVLNMGTLKPLVKPVLAAGALIGGVILYFKK